MNQKRVSKRKTITIDGVLHQRNSKPEFNINVCCGMTHIKDCIKTKGRIYIENMIIF